MGRKVRKKLLRIFYSFIIIFAYLWIHVVAIKVCDFLLEDLPFTSFETFGNSIPQLLKEMLPEDHSDEKLEKRDTERSGDYIEEETEEAKLEKSGKESFKNFDLDTSNK